MDSPRGRRASCWPWQQSSRYLQRCGWHCSRPQGLRFDLDSFALWAHQVAVGPIGGIYGGDLNLPPVMVYIWAILGAVQPAFHTAIDASDVAIRVLLKTPATLADIGLVLAAAWSMRDRPRWAIVGALAVGLQPALIDDSAWWGQLDALYVLPAFIAFLLARASRPIPAAIALGISLMTKPQAWPFIVPFAAFAMRRLSPAQFVAAAGVVAGTVALLWAPFVLDNGPADWLHTVAGLQSGGFNLLSIWAWNLWWLAGPLVPPGLVTDSTPLLGPLPASNIGLALAAVGELVIFAAIWRDPSPRRLALGLACTTLVTFSFLVGMHERYAIAALVFLIPLLPGPSDPDHLACPVGSDLGEHPAHGAGLVSDHAPGRASLRW